MKKYLKLDFSLIRNSRFMATGKNGNHVKKAGIMQDICKLLNLTKII